MDEAPGVRIVRIILVILAVILFISLIIWIFRPNTPDPTEDLNTGPVQFSTVRYVQEGEITAPENHYSIVITVSSTSRRIEVYRGYDVGPKRSDTFTNNQASYDALYAGLTTSGFFNEREDSNNLDRQGYCPLGIRYDYEAGDDIAIPTYSTWGASCSSRAGTFAGKASTVKRLFTNQIPEYREFIKGVRL